MRPPGYAPLYAPRQPAPEMHQIHVPPNVGPGDQVSVMLPNGRQCSVVVPQGSGPNSVLSVMVPPPAPYYMPQMPYPGVPPPVGGPVHPMHMMPGAHMMGHPCVPVPVGSSKQMHGTTALAAAAVSAVAAKLADGYTGPMQSVGRGKGRKRKERVPRQKSAYTVFMKTEVVRLKRENAGMTHRQAFTTAARKWAEVKPASSPGGSGDAAAAAEGEEDEEDEETASATAEEAEASAECAAASSTAADAPTVGAAAVDAAAVDVGESADEASGEGAAESSAAEAKDAEGGGEDEETAVVAGGPSAADGGADFL